MARPSNIKFPLLLLGTVLVFSPLVLLASTNPILISLVAIYFLIGMSFLVTAVRLMYIDSVNTDNSNALQTDQNAFTASSIINQNQVAPKAVEVMIVSHGASIAGTVWNKYYTNHTRTLIAHTRNSTNSNNIVNLSVGSATHDNANSAVLILCSAGGGAGKDLMQKLTAVNINPRRVILFEAINFADNYNDLVKLTETYPHTEFVLVSSSKTVNQNRYQSFKQLWNGHSNDTSASSKKIKCVTVNGASHACYLYPLKSSSYKQSSYHFNTNLISHLMNAEFNAIQETADATYQQNTSSKPSP